MRLLEWMLQLAHGLSCFYTQAVPIIHHDIKPANILVDPNTNKNTFADFGIARICADVRDVVPVGGGAHICIRGTRVQSGPVASKIAAKTCQGERFWINKINSAQEVAPGLEEHPTMLLYLQQPTKNPRAVRFSNLLYRGHLTKILTGLNASNANPLISRTTPELRPRKAPGRTLQEPSLVVVNPDRVIDKKQVARYNLIQQNFDQDRPSFTMSFVGDCGDAVTVEPPAFAFRPAPLFACFTNPDDSWPPIPSDCECLWVCAGHDGQFCAPIPYQAISILQNLRYLKLTPSFSTWGRTSNDPGLDLALLGDIVPKNLLQLVVQGSIYKPEFVQSLPLLTNLQVLEMEHNPSTDLVIAMTQLKRLRIYRGPPNSSDPTVWKSLVEHPCEQPDLEVSGFFHYDATPTSLMHMAQVLPSLYPKMQHLSLDIKEETPGSLTLSDLVNTFTHLRDLRKAASPSLLLHLDLTFDAQIAACDPGEDWREAHGEDWPWTDGVVEHTALTSVAEVFEIEEFFQVHVSIANVG
ncbi:hypothetical protein BC832DRAFT_536491 [Gaertneriomyces semiglobifer]|nr:hypothetical protein BC832DRAFT_536491 [Gaertneriomyces semiglobifer]